MACFPPGELITGQNARPCFPLIARRHVTPTPVFDSAWKVYVVEANRRYRGAEANTSTVSFKLVEAGSKTRSSRFYVMKAVFKLLLLSEFMPGAARDGLSVVIIYISAFKDVFYHGCHGVLIITTCYFKRNCPGNVFVCNRERAIVATLPVGSEVCCRAN